MNPLARMFLSSGWRRMAGWLATVILTVLPATAPAAEERASTACPALLRHSFPTLLDERVTPLCNYQGKVLLVVNTASYCGFTPQYKGLESLFERYRDRGLVVLGFPANDFGRQEPGSAKEIAEFCENTYGVRFPMFAKTTVVGGAAHPFYKALAARTGRSPQWNFHKYLIDRTGERVSSFDSQVEPGDRRLIAQLESFLADR